MIKPEMRVSCACVVIADKIYIRDRYRSYVYEPKESKWETDDILNSKLWVNACVVDDVLMYNHYKKTAVF